MTCNEMILAIILLIMLALTGGKLCLVYNDNYYHFCTKCYNQHLDGTGYKTKNELSEVLKLFNAKQIIKFLCVSLLNT